MTSPETLTPPPSPESAKPELTVETEPHSDEALDTAGPESILGHQLSAAAKETLLEVDSKLDAIRHRPDVVEATDDYMRENLERLDQLSTILEMLHVVRDSEALDTVLEAPASEEFVDSLVTSILQQVEQSEAYRSHKDYEQKVAEMDDKMSRLPRPFIAQSPYTSTDQETREAADVLGIKINPVKFKISRKYRDQIRRQAGNQAYGLYHDRQMYGNGFRSQPHQIHGIDTQPFEGVKFNWPEPDVLAIDDYETKAKTAVAELRKTLSERMAASEEMIGDLVRIPDDEREETVREKIRKALWSVGRQAMEEIEVSDLLFGVIKGKTDRYGDKRPNREQLTGRLLANANRIINQTFTETALPIYYAIQDEELMQRIGQLSEGLDSFTDHDRSIDLSSHFVETFEGFIESIDRNSALYWHATPVLDTIIESGKLSPRERVPLESRTTNTGDHSKGVHFSREGFDYMHYSQSETKKDIERNSWGRKVRRDKEGIAASGIIIPLGVVVEQSPIRDERSRILPSKNSNPTRRKARDSDVVFYGSMDKRQRYKYDYPLEQCFITVSEDISEHTRETLLANGYSEEWISQHLVVIPLEMFGRDALKYRGSRVFLGDTGRKMNLESDYKKGGSGWVDQKTGRAVRLGHTQARIDAYVSRRIKQQLEPHNHIIPLRVVENGGRKEHTDILRWNDPNRHKNARWRRTSSSQPYSDNYVEQLIVV